MSWEPDEFGALVVVAPVVDATYSERDRDLARGSRRSPSLALGSARHVSELERFHELAETLDAIFWEAEPKSLTFMFLSRRASSGPRAGDRHLGGAAPAVGRPHRAGRPRTTMTSTLPRRRHDPGRRSRSRVPDPRARGGRPSGFRDIVHVAVDAKGQDRGPGSHRRRDRTQARRAGPAPERAEVLRGLPPRARGDPAAARARRDEEHVPRGRLARPPHAAHIDPGLRGYARAVGAGHPPAEDAVDLLSGSPRTPRKLERLLGDLLDLDRLQRGIITPQRRRIDDPGALVRDAVQEFEQLGGREVECGSDELIASVDPQGRAHRREPAVERRRGHTSPDRRIWAHVERQ